MAALVAESLPKVVGYSGSRPEVLRRLVVELGADDHNVNSRTTLWI